MTPKLTLPFLPTNPLTSTSFFRSDDEFDENSVEAQQASIDRSPRVPEQMKRGLSDIMTAGDAGNGDAKVRHIRLRISSHPGRVT